MNKETGNSRLGRIIFLICLAIHIVAVVMLATGQMLEFLVPDHRWTFPGCDLWSMVQAGYDFTHGAGIYTPDNLHPAWWGPAGFPFVLPPWMAIVLGIPLSLLTPGLANIVMWLLLEAALAGLAYACWKLAGKGLHGMLAASLCLIAAPQLIELHHGQTDTFIALGLAMLLLGLDNTKKPSSWIGIALSIGIKPIGMFILPPFLLHNKHRIVALISLTLFILLVVAAFVATLAANPGMIRTELNVQTALEPGSTAFSLSVLRPVNDYALQFIKFLIVGREAATKHFFPSDLGFMNLLRVLGLPWHYFLWFILLTKIFLTWRKRKAGIDKLTLAWMLLPFWILPVVWGTYYLLVLPIAAMLIKLKGRALPLIPALLLVLPNPLGLFPAAVEQTYPLPPEFAIIVIINLAVRIIGLGWLSYIAWQQAGKAARETAG